MSRSNPLWIGAVILLLGSLALADKPENSKQEDKSESDIKWVKGPTVASLGTVAQIKVPEGFLFTDKTGTQKLMELTHNPTSGDEVGTLVKRSESYFIVFEFNEVGYIKDDDKDKLNPDELLQSIKEGTEEGNKVRREKGWPAFHVVGWDTKPFYDPATHNLTWAILGRGDSENTSSGSTTETEDTINYSTRILGRRGTMNVDLVVDKSEAQKVVPEFNNLMAGYNFTAGSKYSEFTKGDKIAGYGLAALVVGGAGAAAVKLGLFAKLWKFLLLILVKLWKLIVIVFVAIGAWFKKMWAKITGKDKPKEAESAPPATT